MLAMDRLFPGTSTPLYAVTLVFHSSPSNGFGTVLDVAGMYVHICNGAAWSSVASPDNGSLPSAVEFTSKDWEVTM